MSYKKKFASQLEGYETKKISEIIGQKTAELEDRDN